MNPKTLEDATAHALEEYPRESCGLVVAKGRKEFYMRCRNIAEDATGHFVMNPEDYAAAEDAGTLKMVVHSHPDDTAHPSDGDRLQCEEWGLPWLILAVHRDPATPNEPAAVTSNFVLEPSGFEVPLVSRDYIFGRQDCYTLVQDFYKRKMGVTLPDFDRTDQFWERGEELYLKNFQEAGFEQIASPSQKGDLILMAIRSDVVNHSGIWLGEGAAMLHHPYQQLSERVVYGGYWAENMRMFIRKVR